MCGITGIARKDTEILKRMNVCLTHRGPDWQGSFINDYISIGHTLLSIRDDISISKQPVINSPPWVLAFNGQIYNTEQLLKDVVNANDHPDSDTYILYKTIEKYGWNFIDYIRGMYAIVLYNTRENLVRLYRDPSGQKCLYYYQEGNDFIFASEIKAVLKYPIKKVVDELSVAIACTIGYLPGDQTLLTSVKKVRPSEYVTFDLSTRLLTKNFFSQNDTNYFPSNIEESFQQLVREHLVSKERVSINLSGGLDSSVLVYEMKKLGYDIHSYSTHFDIDDEQINKDALLANKLAREYSTDHTEIDIDKKKFWDNFIEAHRTIEEPNYNVSLPVYLITAKMEGINGDQNRVVLSGDGGDEIFGGYSHYKESLRFSKIENMLTPYVFSFIKNVRSGTDFKFYKSDERWLFFKIFQHSWVKEEHLDAIKKYVSDSTEEWVELYGSKRGPVYDMMLRDRILWLAGENFIRTDKIFMSQSIEMRAPLSYAPFRAHMDSLIPDDQYIGPVNKIYLRKIYEHKLPEYIVNRQDKTGWRAPISQWYDKSAKNLFLEILSSKHLTGRLIDWEQLRQYIVERDGWPGKHVHIYLSLAILAREYNIDL